MEIGGGGVVADQTKQKWPSERALNRGLRSSVPNLQPATIYFISATRMKKWKVTCLCGCGIICTTETQESHLRKQDYQKDVSVGKVHSRKHCSL